MTTGNHTTDKSKQEETYLNGLEFASLGGFGMLIGGVLALVISPQIAIIAGLALWIVANYYGYKTVRDE